MNTFPFFTKAYKILYSIYEFKYKNEKDFNNEIDTEYEKFIELFDEDQKMKNNGLREKVDKFTSSNNFNKGWFVIFL